MAGLRVVRICQMSLVWRRCPISDYSPDRCGSLSVLSSVVGELGPAIMGYVLMRFISRS